MTSTKENKDLNASKSYEKLARLYHFIEQQGGWCISKIEKIIELEGDINYQVPKSSCLRFIKPDCIGNTALHFLAQHFNTESIFIPPNSYTYAERYDRRWAELLINHGADPTIKNQQGLTPIHDIIRRIYKINFESDDPYMTNGKLTVPFIDELLAASIRQQNTTNPRDPYGISHFHAACIINNAESVEFYLNNRVSIDEAVNVDSPMFPGYTPLHFVARLGCVEVANILLSRGPNLLLKDSEGMTAFHLAIERNMRVNQFVNWFQRDADSSSIMIKQKIEGCLNPKQIKILIEQEIKGCLTQIKNTECIIKSILSKMDKATVDSLHLFPFHVMYTLKDALFMENDINEAVDVNSHFWPGYTPLHFAARLNLDTFKMLLKNGANMETKDANGDTPFDLCVGTYEVDDIYEIFYSNVKWQAILLSDGKTKLADLLRTMRDSSEFKNYIVNNVPDINDICIPTNSPVWPACTILHLAVILLRKFIVIKEDDCPSFDSNEVRPSELIEVCVRLGADVTIQNFNGFSPLHLALRRLDLDDTYFLIENCNWKSNPVDRDNLSHLHIACAMSNEKAVKNLINLRVDVNGAVSSSFKCKGIVNVEHAYYRQKKYISVCSGSTALHIAVIVGSRAIVKLLMGAGADLNAKDVNGMTALHLLFLNSALKGSIGEILVSSLVFEDRVANGLNYLHVAAYGNCPQAIEKFVRLGTDVNSAILAESFFNEFEGNTPLHTAVENKNKDAAVVLMTYGANIYAKNSKDESPICGILTENHLLRHFMSVMNDDDEKRLIDEMGVTKLHMACRLYDEKTIQDFVENGANVNAQVHNDSKIWPGYTPLHIIFACCYDMGIDKISKLMRYLLNNGADITIADSQGDTPVLLDFQKHHGDILECDVELTHMNILMESLKDTVVNPVNLKGISHFHVACVRNNVAVVERFLQLGVDVNQTVDYFSNVHPGFTPLHFAGNRQCETMRSDIPPLKIIHSLLKYGANVHARDAKDNTPLHIAARYKSRFHLPYRRILWAGADPEARNIHGKVPRDHMIDRDYFYFCDWLQCCFGCGNQRGIVGL